MKYGDRAASTRQRMLQYLPHLRRQGIDVEVLPLLDNQHLLRVAEARRASPMAIGAAYARRIDQILRGSRADVTWVHCELFPYLPGIFERLVSVSGGRVVYDFDDAIFHMYDQHPSAAVRSILGRKLEPLLRRAAACSCGNEYLRAYAADYCSDCRIFPTVVDTDVYVPARRSAEQIVVGWIGSPSTWPYVTPYLPTLLAAAARHGAVIRAVGAGPSAVTRKGIEAIDWSEEREIAEVQAMDIGIMPVPDEPWARGKSGYKLIQYGACALPVVASPIGVNQDIVVHGVTGFLARTPAEWGEQLSTLLADHALRARMGAAGRERIDRLYSLRVHAPRLEQLFRMLAR